MKLKNQVWKIPFFGPNEIFSDKNTYLMGTETKMNDPILFPMKKSYFFGKELVNWSSISGVMKSFSWKFDSGKIKIGILAL